MREPAKGATIDSMPSMYRHQAIDAKCEGGVNRFTGRVSLTQRRYILFYLFFRVCIATLAFASLCLQLRRCVSARHVRNEKKKRGQKWHWLRERQVPPKVIIVVFAPPRQQ